MLITRTLSFSLSLRSAALGATKTESVSESFVLEYRGPLLSHERASAGGGAPRWVPLKQEIDAVELKRILQAHLGDWRFDGKDEPGGHRSAYDDARRIGAQEALLGALAKVLERISPGRTVSLSIPEAARGEVLKLYPDRT